MYEQYTDKQIVEMLKPKLEKLGWEPEFFSPRMEKLISILYKSGYIRGQLGRSFIIGEKKANEKKVKEPANTFKVGDKVKFLGFSIEDEETLNDRLFYPPVNTVGKVLELGSEYCFVQWPDGATVDNGVWACRNTYLKKVVEHWVPATEVLPKEGDKVKMIDRDTVFLNWLPENGTIGVVISTDSQTAFVQWTKGSTSRDDKWNSNLARLEVLLCE